MERPLRVQATNAVEFFSQIAVEFDAKYRDQPNYKERYEIWTRIIAKYSNSSYRSLDVGCGTGIFSFYLASKNGSVIGVDASKDMIELCERRKTQAGLNNIRFLNYDIHELNSASIRNMNLVICSSVLEYIEDLDTSLDKIYSLLDANGLFIFSMPNKSSFYRKMEPIICQATGWPAYYKYVRNVLTLTVMAAMLMKHGFGLLESAYYGKVPLVSKAFRKVGLSKYSDTLFLIVAQRS